MLHDPNEMTLFPKLTDDDLENMKQYGAEIELSTGDVLFTEGDSNYQFHVVLEGAIEVTKEVGSEKRVLAVHRRGDFMGELSMLTSSDSIASAHAIAPSRVLRIDTGTFKGIISQCSPIADVILTAMAGRTKDVEVQLRQQEKMAALGKMSAGLAHELNNPGAAARRAACQLKDNFQNLQNLGLHLNSLSLEQLKFILNLQSQATKDAVHSPKLDPLTQSDQEDEVTDWLEDHDVSNGWKLSSTLVCAGFNTFSLDTIADNIPEECLAHVLTWLEASVASFGLINEIEQSTTRISDLVKAIKGYSYMDQAPYKK